MDILQLAKLDRAELCTVDSFKSQHCQRNCGAITVTIFKINDFLVLVVDFSNYTLHANSTM